jgi:hypothetical protein
VGACCRVADISFDLDLPRQPWGQKVFFSIEQFAVFLGVVNALILIVKPVARLHARLDVLECKIQRLESVVDSEGDRG